MILDDVDHILQSRNDSAVSGEEKVHNEIIRKILTFTDGLTSQKSKILVSTNLEYHRIDKALVRDFRLFDSIELRALNYEEARKIWSETYTLKSTDFDSLFNIGDNITAAKLAKTIESYQNGLFHEDALASHSYLKEDGISKIKSLRNKSGRIGLV